jgi:hypothetical protein
MPEVMMFYFFSAIFTLWFFVIIFINLRIKKITKDLQDKNIILEDRQSNFFGQSSKKYKQVRGNGLLVLTQQELFFEMYLPQKSLVIDRANIKAISTPRSFLGKSKLIQLLRVDFINAEGNEDAAAWAVRDLNSWVTELKR